MATIRELANIRSGNAGSSVSRNLDEALTYLEQYGGANERAAEINKSLEDLTTKAGKGSKKAALKSSIKSFLASAIVNASLGLVSGGIGSAANAPKIATDFKKFIDLLRTSKTAQGVIHGAIGAGTAYGEEKKRQEGVFDQVDKLKKKYKGTKEYDFINDAALTVSDSLDETLKGRTITEGMLAAFLPPGIGDAGLTKEAASEATNVLGIVPIDKLGLPEQSMMSNLMPFVSWAGDDAIGKIGEFQEGIPGQMLSVLARLGYSPTMAGMGPEYESPQLVKAQFNNPYRGA